MSFLIKQDGLYYSILPEYYDEDLDNYIPLDTMDFNEGFSIDELLNGFEVESVDITPIMTSNTTPSPYVISASGILSSLYKPYKAFDKSNGTLWLTTDGSRTGWIQIDFGGLIIVDCIEITSFDDYSASIKDFKIQGSNDGVDFLDILTITNQTWSSFESKLYPLSNSVNYRYYRFTILSNNGRYNYSGMSGIRLFRNSKTGYSKPIEKFNNFQLISENSQPLNLQAIKSNSELITANGDIPFYIAESANSFTPITNITEGSLIKMVVSIDGGATWLTHDGQDFVQTNISIPLKEYSDMTLEEKALYESNKATILNGGFSIEDLSSIDFNTISGENLRCAYVIYRPDYLSQAECSEIKWGFNAIGSVTNVKRSEFICDVYSYGVNITSKIESPLMMVNVFGSQILKDGIIDDDKMPLDKPILSVTQSGLVSWSTVNNAGSYKVFVNGNEVAHTTQTQYQFNDIDDWGTYIFTMYAIPADDKLYDISPYSNSITIEYYGFLAKTINGDPEYVGIVVNGEIVKLRVKSKN